MRIARVSGNEEPAEIRPRHRRGLKDVEALVFLFVCLVLALLIRCIVVIPQREHTWPKTINQKREILSMFVIQTYMYVCTTRGAIE